MSAPLDQQRPLLTEGDAALAREMMRHYSARCDERLKVALTLQGLLFAALGFAWDKTAVLPQMLAVVGTIATVAMVCFVGAAEHDLVDIKNWWEHRLEGRAYEGPPIFASSEQRMTGSLWPLTPLQLLFFALGIAWGALTFVAFRQILLA